jgi:hypothetical protein
LFSLSKYDKDIIRREKYKSFSWFRSPNFMYRWKISKCDKFGWARFPIVFAYFVDIPCCRQLWHILSLAGHTFLVCRSIPQNTHLSDDWYVFWFCCICGLVKLIQEPTFHV